MSSSFKTIIAIVVAALVIGILPLMAVSERANDQAQVIAESRVSDFVNNAATTGSIKQKNYDDLVSKLSATGNTYDISIEVERMAENIGVKTAWIHGDVMGENSTYKIYTQSVEEDLKRTGLFNLNRGDKVTVTVKNRNNTIASNFRSFVYGIGGQRNYDIVAGHTATVTKSGGR